MIGQYRWGAGLIYYLFWNLRPTENIRIWCFTMYFGNITMRADTLVKRKKVGFWVISQFQRGLWVGGGFYKVFLYKRRFNGPNGFRRGEGVRLRFNKVTRCHLIPDTERIGYNTKGGDIYTKFGVYTPWC